MPSGWVYGRKDVASESCFVLPNSALSSVSWVSLTTNQDKFLSNAVTIKMSPRRHLIRDGFCYRELQTLVFNVTFRLNTEILCGIPQLGSALKINK